MESANPLALSEEFVVVDRRDKQAVLRAILELEREITPAERAALRGNRHEVVKAVLAFEKEQARFDTVLEQVQEHVNQLFATLRRSLADRSLIEAKNALYDVVLAKSQPGRPVSDERAVPGLSGIKG